MKPAKHDAKAEELMTKAVAAIVLEDPFYGYLLLRQDVVQDANIPTACVNGKRLRYNPAFLRSLTNLQIKGLLKHEIMHVAYMHHLRRGTRDPEKWNIAGDYVINALLVENGVELPPNGLIDKTMAEHSTEHVYSILPDPPKRPRPGKGGDGPPESIQPGDGSEERPDDGKWNWGGVEDAPGSEDEATRQEMEDEIKSEVIAAANAAKVHGKLPANIERLLDHIRQSKMPWRKILARFFRATAKNDYTWLRPNRRFLASNIYLPSLHSDALGPIVIGVDTSGSVSGDEMAAFFGCINGILKQTKPESIHVVYCDAEVNNVQVFRPNDIPLTINKFKPRGGGGTSFVPVFEYIKEKRLAPAAMLYLTDMYGTFPQRAPSYPVIWCATSKEKAPFGKTLEIA